MYSFHWLKKVEQDQWDTLGSQLGVVWNRSELERLNSTPSGAQGKSESIFVPLSLVINPDLVEGLLKKSRNVQNQSSTGPVSDPSTPMPSGDGLNTGMALPTGEEVVNMASLPKDEFLSVIRASGLTTESSKK